MSEKRFVVRVREAVERFHSRNMSAVGDKHTEMQNYRTRVIFFLT